MPNDCLTSGELRLEVSRQGAELVSLRRRDVGFLYRDGDLSAPAKGWANHSTVMGYFLHRLRNEHSLYRGKEIIGRTHGFLRKKNWKLISDPSESRLSYEITPDDYTATEYPLAVSLRLSYEIEGGAVRVVFEFTNHESDLSAHLGFGLHPGFAAESFESFRFQMPRGLYRHYLTRENFLSGETKEIQFEGGAMPFPRENLPGSYILGLTDLAAPVFTFSDPGSGREVDLDLTEVPYLTLWSDGGPFLCVEPCWGLTDHFEQRAFEDKEGIQIVPPNETCRRSFTMTPRLIN